MFFQKKVSTLTVFVASGILNCLTGVTSPVSRKHKTSKKQEMKKIYVLFFALLLFGGLFALAVDGGIQETHLSR